MLLQKLTLPLLVIMCYMSCGVQAAPTHSVTEIDEQVKVLYSGDQIIYANLTAYNAITLLIARGAAECKLIQ